MTATTTSAHPDAELFRRIDAYREAGRRWTDARNVANVADLKAWKKSPELPLPRWTYEVADRLGVEEDAATAALLDHPPESLGGLVAKLKALAERAAEAEIIDAIVRDAERPRAGREAL
jgi:hypothetical protein